MIYVEEQWLDGQSYACLFGMITQWIPTPGQEKWEKSYLGGNKGFGYLWWIRIPDFYYQRFPTHTERKNSSYSERV